MIAQRLFPFLRQPSLIWSMALYTAKGELKSGLPDWLDAIVEGSNLADETVGDPGTSCEGLPLGPVEPSETIF
jgi:hypothetical protein